MIVYSKTCREGTIDSSWQNAWRPVPGLPNSIHSDLEVLEDLGTPLAIKTDISVTDLVVHIYAYDTKL